VFIHAHLSSEKLTAYDIAICRAYAYKIRQHISDDGWDPLRSLYSNDMDPLPSLDATRSYIHGLSGFAPQIFDCCKNSCLCYAGPHADKTSCDFCGESRFRKDGKAKKRFTYIPLIPRLKALARNRTLAEKMRNRAQRDTVIAEEVAAGAARSKVRDIFDSTNYEDLKKRKIKIHDQTLPRKYFADPRDVALGLCTDGVGPFKTRKVTCWPLIVFNYNLPTDLMFLLEYIMSLGVIPGPNKPKDVDSFLWAFGEEMLQLANGVRTFDIIESEFFMLRAFLILAFGDIPAISMLMRMKGHNGICPCRMCTITGLRVPGDTNNMAHYVPLDRHAYPHKDPAMQDNYDPLALPLRTHEQFVRHAEEVETARTKAAADDLAKKYGIKGRSILFVLDSLSFPRSFPYDFMHLIWENLIKNLVLLWTGRFKGFDSNGNRGPYVFAPGVWEAIGKATAQTKKHIPSAYGAALPDLAADGVRITAEQWSFWTLFVAPVVLRGKFKDERYYNHFIELVRLLHICLQFEITREEIDDIRTGFAKWVQDFER
jgi:hypothetical protein